MLVVKTLKSLKWITNSLVTLPSELGDMLEDSRLPIDKKRRERENKEVKSFIYLRRETSYPSVRSNGPRQNQTPIRV